MEYNMIACYPYVNLQQLYLIACCGHQLENSLEREKKARADVEKVKRKLEVDLKANQEVVEELERTKQSLEEAARRLVA